MPSITANQLKTKGISALAPIIDKHKAALITVRGENRYVIMDFDTYNHLRECELEAAIVESKRELEQGKVYKDTIDEHISRIVNEL